ncbi:unnamed protein product [Amoebophrya sp. A120]|nr:unnamed protein product [Amoebophrya sp. A120]|eukprot:GSA120T00014280001.1
MLMLVVLHHLTTSIDEKAPSTQRWLGRASTTYPPGLGRQSLASLGSQPAPARKRLGRMGRRRSVGEKPWARTITRTGANTETPAEWGESRRDDGRRGCRGCGRA